jgi:hypothetical protein
MVVLASFDCAFCANQTDFSFDSAFCAAFESLANTANREGRKPAKEIERKK